MTKKDTRVLLRLLSVSFSYPDKTLVQLITAGALQKDIFDAWIAKGLPEEVAAQACESMLYYQGKDPEEVKSQLRQEYTRLFLGEAPVVSHSEGVWLCRKEGYNRPPLIVNPRSLEVQKFQQSCGVVRADGYNDSVDTVDVECEFAAYLADDPQLPEELKKTPEQAYEEFLDLHMKKWIPGFCQDVRETADTVYYKNMVDLLDGLISAE